MSERECISELLRGHMPGIGRCWCGFNWQRLGEWSDHVADIIGSYEEMDVD